MQYADLTKKSRTLYNIKKLFLYIKMDKQILTFGDIEIEKKNTTRRLISICEM